MDDIYYESMLEKNIRHNPPDGIPPAAYTPTVLCCHQSDSVGGKKWFDLGDLGDLGAYIISVTMKSTHCIQAMMCATNGGATIRVCIIEATTLLE